MFPKAEKYILLSQNAAVLHCKPTITVQKLSDLMVMAKVGSYLVVDANMRVLGIVTERDILRCLGTSWVRLKNKQLTAKDIMTPVNRLVMCTNAMSKQEMLEKMNEAGIRHMVVGTSDGKQIDAVVSLRGAVKDVLSALA